jgi:O-antigen/teichoic acid export membrane protein
MPQARLRRNFVFNLIYPVVRLAVALVTIPIYVRHVGDARYGVISIVWVLLGYFGFLDLGLSRAATNALAKLRDAPQAHRARVLLTTTVLNLSFGLIGAVLLFVVGGYLLERILSVPEALKPEVARALPWIACLFPMALVSGVGLGALESRERFLLANLFQMFGMSMSQIAPVVMAVFVSPSLTVVIPSAAIAQATSVIVLIAYVYWLEGPFSLRAFNRKEARTLLSYGGWVTVTAAINSILASADQFLIGSLIGVAEVAHYAIPMNLVLRTQTLPVALGRTFFPRMSMLSREGAHTLGGRALQALGYGYAAVCAPAIILAPAFFRYWIGPNFALVSAPVAQILFLGAWINGLAFVAYTLIQSQGRPDLTGKLHFAEVLPFLCILSFLTSTFGITGAAAAWSLRAVVDAFAMFWAAGISRRIVVAAIARPVALLCGSEVISRFVGSGLGLALPAAILAGLIAIGLAYSYSDDWRHFLAIQFARARSLAETLIRRAKPAQSSRGSNAAH